MRRRSLLKPRIAICSSELLKALLYAWTSTSLMHKSNATVPSEQPLLLPTVYSQNRGHRSSGSRPRHHHHLPQSSHFLAKVAPFQPVLGNFISWSHSLVYFSSLT